MKGDSQPGVPRSSSLVDVLDRVLDKGLVIAGDIKVSLAEVELITIRVRLLVCSIDKAEQIGLDWWKFDRSLSSNARADNLEAQELRHQVRLLERKLAALSPPPPPRRIARARSGSKSHTRPGGHHAR